MSQIWGLKSERSGRRAGLLLFIAFKIWHLHPVLIFHSPVLNLLVFTLRHLDLTSFICPNLSRPRLMCQPTAARLHYDLHVLFVCIFKTSFKRLASLQKATQHDRGENSDKTFTPIFCGKVEDALHSWCHVWRVVHSYIVGLIFFFFHFQKEFNSLLFCCGGGRRFW